MNPPVMLPERKLFILLQARLAGAYVNNSSGLMNLLNLRRRYFEVYFMPQLTRILEKTLTENHTRQTVIEMLYDFFSFAFEVFYDCYTLENEVSTLLHINLSPLWAARHFYFMKVKETNQAILVRQNGITFRFLPKHKDRSRANRCRFAYTLRDANQKNITIEVSKTKRKWQGLNRLKEEIEKSGLSITENLLITAIKIFEHQFISDYFLPKKPKSLLLNLLQIWLAAKCDPNNILLTRPIYPQFTRIACQIIGLISQFENELVRIWNKPKFVLWSHYVITLDRILDREPAMLEKISRHHNLHKQIEEWCSMRLVSPEHLSDNYLLSEPRSFCSFVEQSPHLPLDTKYFTDIESLLVKIFDPLDTALDGWLIHSENYQALNTLRRRFGNRIQTIYVDPPFNKNYDAGFSYDVNFNNTAWITLLENRFRIALEFLRDDGCMLVRCDSSGNMFVRLIMDDIFGQENFRNELHVRRYRKNVPNGRIRKLPSGLDTIFLYSKSNKFRYLNPARPRKKPRKGFWRHMNDSSGKGTPKIFFGRTLAPPSGKHWKYSQQHIDKMIRERRLILQCRQCGHMHTYENGCWKGCPQCGVDDPVPRYWVEEKTTDVLDSNWSDIYGYSRSWGFQTENSEPLLKRIIEITSQPNDLVMDFFLGSGTTAAVAHKLGRKWLGIEMGDHFFKVALPRMKLVLAGEQSGISREINWQGGGFFKYYTLDQYWDALHNVKMYPTGVASEFRLLDMRYRNLLSSQEMMAEKMFEKPHGIWTELDVAETLANLMGLQIRRILSNRVVLAGGMEVDTTSPPNLIRSLF